VEQANSRPRLHLEWIDPDALDIVKRLQREGHLAYLVGGCVRDLLAGTPPKDFDIATTASPQQVRRTIYNSFIIGRRFRLVLVKRNDKQFEVATFRKEYDPKEFPEGPPAGDNIFGSPKEDATRRDFTVNALMFDPVKSEIIDYCNGLIDIDEHLIRMIGDPDVRLKEDPIRILRALRLAHKLRFSIEANLRNAISKNAADVEKSVLPRRREEILKILRLTESFLTFQEAHDLGVLNYLIPSFEEIFTSPEKKNIFAGYIHRLHQFVDDPNQPVELFAILTLAYYRSTIEQDPKVAVHVNDVLEHSKIQPLFKNHLGLFNYEQRLIARALHLQLEIMNVADFTNKKDSQKAALVTNEAFGIALLMAYADHLISPAQLHYLKTEQERLVKIQRAHATRTVRTGACLRKRHPGRPNGSRLYAEFGDGHGRIKSLVPGFDELFVAGDHFIPKIFFGINEPAGK
jgi:poly(A) polymerase